MLLPLLSGGCDVSQLVTDEEPDVFAATTASAGAWHHSVIRQEYNAFPNGYNRYATWYGYAFGCVFHTIDFAPSLAADAVFFPFVLTGNIYNCGFRPINSCIDHKFHKALERKLMLGAAPTQENIRHAILQKQLPALKLLLEYGGKCDSYELLRPALDNFMILEYLLANGLPARRPPGTPAICPLHLLLDARPDNDALRKAELLLKHGADANEVRRQAGAPPATPLDLALSAEKADPQHAGYYQEWVVLLKKYGAVTSGELADRIQHRQEQR